MGHRLEIVLLHSLPGRIRLGFSHPLKQAVKAERNIGQHAGIDSVSYTAETQNLLICYAAEEIAMEEIIIRVALSFSAKYGLSPVTIKASQPTTALTELSLISGLALVTGHLMLLINHNKAFQTVKLISGVGTSAAVLEHTYSDLKHTGRFHPEVLSIGYLIASFIRGNILKGATIAWIMTFARHLMEPPAKRLKIEPEAINPECDEDRCEYEATISNQHPSAAQASLFNRLPGLLLGIYRDMSVTIEDRIFKEIWKVSDDHNDVLEGIENLDRGIRLQVKK